MKIIQKKPLEAKGTCPKCNSMLMVSRKDLKVSIIWDDVYLYCPVCGSKAYLTDEQREYFKI